MTPAQRERASLVETMRSIGPDAPTLCEGWTTRDLAAHLVVRERRLDATPGIMIPLLAGYTDKVQRQVAASTDWDELLNKIASGPPTLSPFKILDPVANMDEMFIHHEDVRRAQGGWEPRALDAATVTALRRPLAIMARLTMAKVPARVTPDARRRDGRRCWPRSAVDCHRRTWRAHALRRRPRRGATHLLRRQGRPSGSRSSPRALTY
jgi:uncharacterized protein (TIGR03085 family)